MAAFPGVVTTVGVGVIRLTSVVGVVGVPLFNAAVAVPLLPTIVDVNITGLAVLVCLVHIIMHDL